MRLRQVVTGAGRLLAEAGVPSPAHDAEALAAYALGLDRLEWALAPEAADEGFTARYAALVERRRRREPLQRIVGSAGFRYLTVVVADDVFVPRPETEVVAQVAVDEAARLSGGGSAPLVVDLCCGSGVIGVSVAAEVPTARVVAVDSSMAAVAATRVNAAGAGARVALRVEVRAGDACDPATLGDLDGTVDVLVANPPYIPPDAVPQDPEVRDHDPDLALYGGGADGLQVPRGVVRAAARLLRPGGLFVMEHAEVQAAAVREVVGAGGFTAVRTERDLTGRERMVVARRAGADAPVTGPDVAGSPL